MDARRLGEATLTAPKRRGLSMRLNSLALIGGKMATMGLGFAVWLVAARLFAPAEVGLASGAVSATMLGVQLALVGVGAAVISLYPRLRDQRAEVLDTAISCVVVTSLVVGGGFLLVASALFGELAVVATTPSYAIAFLAMCLFGTLGVLFDQIATVQGRGEQMLARNALFGVITLGVLAGVPLLADTSGALPILGAWVVGGLIATGAGYAQLCWALPGYRFRGRVQPRLAASLVGVGLPNWALTVVERAPGAVMPIAVVELLSPEANATWYASWMMAWVVFVVPIQVGLSQFAEAVQRPGELRGVARQGIRLSLTVGAVAAGGAVALGPFMLSFLGDSYAAAGTTPLRILVLAVLPFAIIQAYYAACRSCHQLGEAILCGLTSGVLGVGMAVSAGVDHGLSAMALAWLVVQVITGAWAAWRLRTLLNRESAQRVEGVSDTSPAAPSATGS